MFNYICEECGKGTVKKKVFENYQTKIKGYPFVVDKAVIGVCDQCGARHFDANETKRWGKNFITMAESNMADFIIKLICLASDDKKTDIINFFAKQIIFLRARYKLEERIY